MNKLPTALAIKPHQSVSGDVWCNFVIENPYCSAEIPLPDDSKLKYKLLNATVMAAVLDNVICWQEFKKLYDIYETLGKFISDQNYDKKTQRYVLNIVKQFNEYIKQIVPINTQELLKQQTKQKKHDFIIDYISRSRQFVYEKLTTQEGINSLYAINRGITLSLYLRQDYDKAYPTVKNFINNKRSQQDIIECLMSDTITVDIKNHFILEDYELIAMSHLFGIPIHFFINYCEQGKNYLTKRRIHHHKEDEKTIGFILEFNQRVAKSVRILFQQHESIFIKNILELSQSNNLQIDILNETLQSVLYQVTHNFSEINTFWIKKIVQILDCGNADTLVANKKQAQISDQLRESLAKLFRMMDKDQNDLLKYQEMFKKQLNEAEEFFENLVITQVTVVRNASLEKKKPPIHSNNGLPNKPKILGGGVGLFTTPQQFQQQKRLTEKGQLQAKAVDSDLPNYSDSDSGRICTKKVEVKEYNTESDEEKYQEPDYIKIVNSPRQRPPVIENSQVLKQQSVILKNNRHSATASIKKKRQSSVDQMALDQASKYQSEFLISSIRKTNTQFMSESNTIQIEKKDRETLTFKPNTSVKTNNINRMSQSQIMRSSVQSVRSEILNRESIRQQPQQQLQSQQYQFSSEYDMLKSHITEVSEKSELQSQIYSFDCPICYSNITEGKNVINLHDNHKMCRDCLESWIKIKFNAGQWNMKIFNCPIQTTQIDKMKSCDHVIEQSIIKDVLTPEEYRMLCDKAMKSNIIDIVCPNQSCQATIKGIPPKSSIGLSCPQCNQKICWVCKFMDHKGSKCPQRLEDIKLALQDERVSCCPECLEIYMKNDGCEHVQCTNCMIDFCFTCSAPRIPIVAHGAHYHRVGCEYRVPWINPKNGQEVLDDEFDTDNCEMCQQTNVACQRPICLVDFKNLAHLNF